MKQPPEPLPDHIGPYRVVDRLGRGGMGEVLRAHDDRLDRPVALKRVHTDARDPEKARQRFRREAQAVALLSHPAIVQVHDWVESDDQDWLVMELVEGRSLEELIAEGPLSPARSVSIAHDVAAGLAAAHEAGLVHRDLKAANVIVTAAGAAAPGRPSAGRIKILDFGLAKLVESGPATKAELKTTLTVEGQVVGTVSAMSPEQALGRPVDHRSDLFSLGTLLYEMLSGVLPFEGDTPVETLTRICTMKEKPLRQLDPELPEDLSRLVDHLLEKEPARRPTGAREVIARLDGLRSVADSAPTAEQLASETQEATLIDAFQAVTDSDVAPAGKRPNRWRGPLPAVGLLIAAGLVAWGAWELLPWPQLSDVSAPDATAGPPHEGARPTRHELFQSGMAYLERYDRQGNVDKAIADFQRALAQDESHAPALAGLARAYQLDFYGGSQDPQRLEQALAAAHQAVGLDDHLALARVSLGLVYFEMGRFEDARQELENALSIEPLNADALYGLGRIAESLEQYLEAEVYYQRSIDARPGNWVPHARLGSLYFRTGRYSEAEAAFLTHLELTPDSAVALRNLGATYYRNGQLAKAATQFQLSLQVQPDPSTYANLGTIYFAQGLYPQSVSAFEKAIESGRSNDYRMWGNLADAYRWTPDNARRAREAFLRAIQLLREKLAATPHDTTLRTRLVLYLAKRGDCRQALTEIAKMKPPRRDDHDARLRLVVANEICAQRDEALVLLERALEAGLPIADVRRDPELLELRQDLRYHRLIMNLRPSPR